jgi:hypothetical protein
MGDAAVGVEGNEREVAAIYRLVVLFSSAKNLLLHHDALTSSRSRATARE